MEPKYSRRFLCQLKLSSISRYYTARSTITYLYGRPAIDAEVGLPIMHHAVIIINITFTITLGRRSFTKLSGTRWRHILHQYPNVFVTVRPALFVKR